MKTMLIIAAILACLCLISCSRSSKKSKDLKIIFTPLKGTITLKGVPLEGVKLTRSYPKGGNDEMKDSIYTDANGAFEFDEVTDTYGFLSFLPTEAVSHQTIYAYYENREYLIWYHCKRNYLSFGEFQYGDSMPILNPEMTQAYYDGYILLNADLENEEDSVQQVKDHVGVMSIIDFKFPHELAKDAAVKDIEARKDMFNSEIKKWIDAHPDYFDFEKKGEDLNEYEREGFKNYIKAEITSVDSVNYFDYVGLWWFDEDYGKETKRVLVSGEIFVTVKNPKGDSLGARIWMRDALFKVSKDSVVLNAHDHSFSVNPSNIDPAVVD